MPKFKDLMNKWETATIEITKFFIEKYFGKTSDWYFIGDEIGGCLFVNDYFFNLDNIVDFLKYDYSVDDMFAYMNLRLEASYKNKDEAFPNIKNWRELKI